MLSEKEYRRNRRRSEFLCDGGDVPPTYSIPQGSTAASDGIDINYEVIRRRAKKHRKNAQVRRLDYLYDDLVEKQTSSLYEYDDVNLLKPPQDIVQIRPDKGILYRRGNVYVDEGPVYVTLTMMRKSDIDKYIRSRRKNKVMSHQVVIGGKDKENDPNIFKKFQKINAQTQKFDDEVGDAYMSSQVVIGHEDEDIESYSNIFKECPILNGNGQPFDDEMGDACRSNQVVIGGEDEDEDSDSNIFKECSILSGETADDEGGDTSMSNQVVIGDKDEDEESDSNIFKECPILCETSDDERDEAYMPNQAIIGGKDEVKENDSNIIKECPTPSSENSDDERDEACMSNGDLNDDSDADILDLTVGDEFDSFDF